MALNIEIRVPCPECDASGERDYGSGPVACLDCGGDGYHAWPIESSDLEDRLNDLEDKVDDVMGKCEDILEEVQE